MGVSLNTNKLITGKQIKPKIPQRKNNNSKAKEKREEKRLARQEKQIKLDRSLEVVRKANSLSDPMERFPAFRAFKKNGIDAKLYVKKVSDLDERTKEWIFELEKTNMKEKYETSSWGWKDWKKREELMNEAAWYLIAESVEGDKLGFSHFRFDLEMEIEVLYCYELQIESDYVGKGLGKFMMQILELIAFTNQLRKVVLTILKNNDCSNFFKHLKYEIDEFSPMDMEDVHYPYEILSKLNKKLIPIEPTHNHSEHQCCPGHH